jgi:hypothetical protein
VPGARTAQGEGQMLIVRYIPTMVTRFDINGLNHSLDVTA